MEQIKRKRPLPQDNRKIRQRRWDSGLTQAQLAQRVDLSAQQMSAIERGTRGVSPAVLRRLADEFDCEVADLMAANDAVRGES